jgi:hypothetical protein
VVCAIKQSILLRCLWVENYLKVMGLCPTADSGKKTSVCFLCSDNLLKLELFVTENFKKM